MTHGARDMPQPPILADKRYDAPSLFTPDGLLREVRRQKRIAASSAPRVCVLDPDGDVVQHLIAEHRAWRVESWACYHTDLYQFETAGCNVCMALRDEGTSYHYLPPAAWSTADEALLKRAARALSGSGQCVERGATWTTDAPFRETSEAIVAAEKSGVVAVEMEAAALYAFATARRKAVLCIAHVTNQMGRVEGDFEKGEAAGASDALMLIARLAAAWSPAQETSTAAAT